MLKSKEVKASSGGGTGGSALLELLLEPTTTVQDLDGYIADNDGRIDLMGLTTLEEELVLSHGNIDKILGSVELFRKLLSNYAVAPMFIMVDGVIDKLCADPILLDILYNAPINGDMIATKRVIPLLYNQNYLKYALADASAMRIIAADPILLDLAFSSYENRRIMFEDGGKAVADVLMRESSYARQWLWDSVSITVSGYGNGWHQTSKRGYYLGQYANGDHTNDSFAGGFFGDYRTGDVNLGDSKSSANPHAINERANVIRHRQSVSTGWTSWARFVQMEA